jgi:hypothetical protein
MRQMSLLSNAVPLRADLPDPAAVTMRVCRIVELPVAKCDT